MSDIVRPSRGKRPAHRSLFSYFVEARNWPRFWREVRFYFLMRWLGKADRNVMWQGIPGGRVHFGRQWWTRPLPESPASPSAVQSNP